MTEILQLGHNNSVTVLQILMLSSLIKLLQYIGLHKNFGLYA